MRLRVTFKLHGAEADLAHRMADACGLTVPQIAMEAMRRYLQEFAATAKEQQGRRHPSDKELMALKKAVMNHYRKLFSGA